MIDPPKEQQPAAERSVSAHDGVLVARNIWKYYSTGPLKGGSGPLGLQDISLALKAGELTCITGRNGQGKSTLIKVLALDEPFSSGHLYVRGRDVAQLNNAEIDHVRNEAIHYIPQGHLGLLSSTAAETVAYWLERLDQVEKVEAQRRAFLALEAVGLPTARFHERVDKLSGGEKARVALASAFTRNRPICLADEIFAAMDQESIYPLLGLFRELCKRGAAVAIIAHQPEVRPYFDRVVIIDNKQVESDTYNAEPKRPEIGPANDAVRSGSSGSLQCGICGFYEAATELFCRHCFAPLHGSQLCPCGQTVLPAGAHFCSHGRCGRRIEPARRLVDVR